MHELVRIAIGVDYREVPGYHAASHSILRRSSIPVSFIPIALNNLEGLMWRQRSSTQSTEFSFSRFLAPYLCGYKGWVLFIDSDVIVLEDIAKLWALRDDKYAVMCVKHDHNPTNATKFLGEKQTQYEKKNWSSVMLMNCEKCTALTPEYINAATGLELHRFHWLEGDHEIGEIPANWNHLVGYSEGELKGQSLLHWTEGTPCWDDCKDAKWSGVFHDEVENMNTAINKSLEACDEKAIEVVV